MPQTQTLALVGAAGGIGTTRLALESGATLARTGRDIAVVDAAFDTQGLARYVEGRIEADATALATGDVELGAALYEQELDTPGRLALCPARAPFERLARAKTAAAARRFEQQLAAAALSHDAVIVDTPPLGGNQALAAVDAADRVAVVTSGDERGADALARLRDRLRDVGSRPDAVIATPGSGNGTLEDAHATVPERTVAPRRCPACVPADETFAPAVAAATEAALGVELDLEFSGGGPLRGILGED